MANNPYYKPVSDSGATNKVPGTILAPTQQVVPTVQPAQPATQNEIPGGYMSLRENLQGQGFNVGYSNQTGQVFINDIPVNTANFRNINGTLYGSPQDIQSVRNQVLQGQGLSGIRDYYSQKGMAVDWNPATSSIIVNGKAITPQMYEGILQNIGGSLYGKPEDLDKLLNMVIPQQAQGQTQTSQVQQPQTQPIPQQVIQPPNYTQAMSEARNSGLTLDVPTRGIQTSLINQLGSYNTNLKDEALQIIRNAFGNPFQYDQNTDPALKQAQAYAENQIMGELNRRGILNSTITPDRLGQAMSALLPQYEQLAFEKYNKNIEMQLKKADYLLRIDENSYNRYKDYVMMQIDNLDTFDSQQLQITKQNLDTMFNVVDRKAEQQIREIQLEESRYNKAMDRIKLLGYVDNEASIVTGIPVGTPTFEAQNEAESRAFELYKKYQDMVDWREKNQIQYGQDIEKIDYKAEIDAYYRDLETQAKNELATNAGLLLAGLADYSPADALEYIFDNQDEIRQFTGGEYFNDLVIRLTQYKKEAERLAYEQQRDARDFALRTWIAQDASARGWDASARGWDAQSISRANLGLRQQEYNLSVEKYENSKNNLTQSEMLKQDESVLYRQLDSMSPEQQKSFIESNKEDLIRRFGKDYWDNLNDNVGFGGF